MKRPTVETFGPRGARVRVLIDGELVRVQWYEQGERRVKSWPNNREGRAEATAWAQGFSGARQGIRAAPAAPLSLRQMWTAFATAEFPALRLRTQQLYREHWQKWELFLGRDFVAESARLEHVDQLREWFGRHGIGVTHAHKIVGTVKRVYNWAEGRELIAVNRLRAYRFKIAKEDRPMAPAEFSAEERDRILAQFDYQRRDGWRPWTAIMLAGHQGVRMHAILHLTWDDIAPDWSAVTWRARYDKTGKDWTQPLSDAGLSALLAAEDWARRDGYTGRWVFYSSHAKRAELPYRKDSLELALVTAERRAGIVHQAGRGMHGFRRGVAGDVLAATRDAKLALDYIGDVDLRQAQRYLKPRTERLEEAVAIVNRHRTVTDPATPSRKPRQSRQARQVSNLQPLDTIEEQPSARPSKSGPPKRERSGQNRGQSPKNGH